MMSIVILLSILFLLILLTFVWPPDSPWSPWWRTNREVARNVCSLIKLSKKDIVYELGSGDGEFILMAGGKFNVTKAVGVEIDYSRYYISRIRAHLARAKNVGFIRGDFKTVNLNDATVVYFYLVPSVIKRIMPKLRKELKSGTKVISYRYEAPLKLLREKDGIYLYQI